MLRRAWPLLAASLALGCQQRAPPAERPPLPVVVATAEARTVRVELDAIGAATSRQTVAVRAQVTGTIESVGFREGEEVREGQVLFQLDARPLRAALDQARANLARDRAQLANARVEAERYGALAPRGIVSRQELDARVAQARALEAAVGADRAAIETARVNLGYATIRSPIDGLAGARQVDAGNLVRASDAAALVTIRQIAPIDVAFSVPASHLDEILRRRREAPLAVVASASSRERGEVRFVDNAVDPQTGTILLKASFPNDDRALWPGAFVPVKLELATIPGAVCVPARAVQTGQSGEHVFVVAAGDVAELRRVRRGPAAGDWVAVDGVSPGERVVADGLLGLAPGVRVAPEPAPPASAGAAPSGSAAPRASASAPAVGGGP